MLRCYFLVGPRPECKGSDTATVLRSKSGTHRLRGSRRRERILGFVLCCNDLPVDERLDRTSCSKQVVTLSEGRCVLRRGSGRAAAALVPTGAGATGSGRPSGVSNRQGVRSVRKDTCKDRVCAPDAFSYSEPRVHTGYHPPPSQYGKGALLHVQKSPDLASEDAMPRLCTCGTKVSVFAYVYQPDIANSDVDPAICRRQL